MELVKHITEAQNNFSLFLMKLRETNLVQELANAENNKRFQIAP